MIMKFLWPGRTKNRELRILQESYAEKIGRFGPCRIIETREARGLPEGQAEKIREAEARSLEKHLQDDYIICLFDKGREMSSAEFARFLERRELESASALAFVVGGFLGLADRILGRADLSLSLSRMTFSHELSRVILLEQVYRAMTMIRGRNYAK